VADKPITPFHLTLASAKGKKRKRKKNKNKKSSRWDCENTAILIISVRRLGSSIEGSG
jgi:hypothetical protein